jgi:hypothetical protein
LVGALCDPNRFDVGTPVYNRAMIAAELREALGRTAATMHQFKLGSPGALRLK